MSLFSFFSSLRHRLLKILGIAILAISSLRIIELILPSDLKIMQLLLRAHLYPANSPQMAIAASIGFVLVGGAFIIWPKNDESFVKKILLLVFSMAIIFLGAVEIFINLLPIHLENNWQMILVHFYTAIGLFLIGLGLIVAKFHGASLQPVLLKNDE